MKKTTPGSIFKQQDEINSHYKQRNNDTNCYYFFISGTTVKTIKDHSVTVKGS